MEIQPTRYMSADLKLGPSSLKQIQQLQKKHLYELSDSRSAIIIDYGSESIKAGYEQSAGEPAIVFRPYISKNRDSNKAQASVKQSINTSYEQLDFQKITFKSAYQRNIILHFSILQQCNDYIFAEMVRPNKQIRSPVVISEPFGNPIHCRNSILQQFFECYQVDSVMVGVDSLFAYFYQVECNLQRYQNESAIVVNIGATTIHVFVILEGKVQWHTVQRINVGGSNAFQLFGKTVQLKNPQLKNKLTYSYLHDLYEKFTQVAIDYNEQLNFFKRTYEVKQEKDYYRNRVEEENKKIDQILQFTMPVQIDFQTFIEIPQEQIRRKEEIKQRMSEKLRETISRRKEMKRRIQEKQLKDLQYMKEKYDQHDPSAHQEVAEQFGQHKAYDKLIKKIKAISIKLGLIEQKHDEKKFALIDIPDNQLPPQKLKFKRMQIYQKKAVEERQERARVKEEEQRKMRELRENNLEEYLAQLRNKYQTLSKRVKENQRIKNQLNNRKSKLKQKKMQVLVKLAEDDEMDQNFGENEDDWLVYKDIEESDHFSEIQAMETELRQIDPEWTQNKKDIHHLNSSNQLFLTSELVKCNEIFFQPRLIGVNQNGIIQTIVSIVSLFNTQTQQKLLSNINIVGGGSQIKGLKERLQRDLRRECPIQSKIDIKVSSVGWKGAFLGMQNIARMQSQFLPKMSYHRHSYEEQMKADSMNYVENSWSNPRPNT